MRKYTKAIEEKIQKLYQSLSESEKRRYAAIEAIKLGHGGIAYISEILNCSYETIAKGMEELDNDELDTKRERSVGGGRKKILEINPEIEDIFLNIIENHTAGNPMDENIKWTNLDKEEISKLFLEKGFEVSAYIVKQLLEKNNYKKRQAYKCETFKDVEGRDEQFKKIENLKEKFMKEVNNPILSIDVKKKSK